MALGEIFLRIIRHDYCIESLSFHTLTKEVDFVPNAAGYHIHCRLFIQRKSAAFVKIIILNIIVNIVTYVSCLGKQIAARCPGRHKSANQISKNMGESSQC